MVGLAFLFLAQCFLGYLLFRVVLTIDGAIAGISLGTAIVVWMTPAPSGADYLVVCGGLALLLALLAWFLWRLGFAIIAGLFAAGVTLVICLATSGSGLVAAGFLKAAIPTGLVVLAVAIGLLVAALAIAYTRQIVIAFTAVLGALGCIFAGASLVSGNLSKAISPPHGAWTLGFLLVLSGLLAGLGIFTQAKLVKVIHSALAPPAGKKGGSDIQPKLSKR